MDPLTAIGLAGNIICFIDFSFKLLSGMSKVLESSSGMTPENANLSALVEDLNSVANDLISDVPARTENEKKLCILATDCHALSGEISQTLKKLKIGDKKSKRQGMMVKIRSMRKEKDIGAIERRLHGYQSEILIRLHVMFSQKSDSQSSMVKIQLENLRSEGKLLRSETTRRLDTLHQDIATLIQAMSLEVPRNGSNTINKDPEDEPLVKLGEALSNLQSTTRSISWQNHILSRLIFPSMYRRGDSIEDPENGTFAWMVKEKFDSLSGRDSIWEKRVKEQEKMRNNTRQQFLTWLNSGSQVFHISGKAGSGKSTLMKFLAESPRVQRELEHWAGTKRLYRSLLFETFIQCPDLIPRVFPTLWEGLSTGVAPPQQTPLHFKEIKAAFGRLVQESQSFDAYICFWIDGLDEFEGDEVDQWHLARDLLRWTESKHIKLCVSSRPHIPFMQTFAIDMNHQISIHELTREDIRQFSLAMFEKDPNFPRVQGSYRELISKVVEDANGVFLWARLVVRSLLKSIGYQTMAKGLEKLLTSMPKGLDELFDQMLNSIDRDDRPLSDKLFLMSTGDFGLPGNRPIIGNAMAYSRLEDLDDPGFPENRPMQFCPISEIDEQVSRVSCILDRFSRGLLEMKSNGNQAIHGHQYFGHDVDFLHRTVRDYLVNTRRDQMQRRVPEFDVRVGIFRLLLADYQFACPTWEDIHPQRYLYSPPIRRQLDALFRFIVGAKGSGQIDMLPGFLEQAYDVTTVHTQPAKLFDGKQYKKSLYLRGQVFGTLDRNDYLNVMELGLHSYLPPRLLARLKKENLSSGPNVLLVAALNNRKDFVEELLREGRSPQEMVVLEQIDSSIASEVSEISATPARLASVGLLFIHQYAADLVRGFPQSEIQPLILQTFLDWGTDPDVEFTISEGPDQNDWQERTLKDSLLSIYWN
ncbi:uncharacterized protein N7477_007106 [Penicillium maclennaniae]|uniref:uncharacterized protein n=1 Tax=Penicillium maclennaniae TaxID=1343394 RepID=UPI0025400404|nr:uncharacterized protein N7477_007106 [Penicillium maclennaniae]KAJ5668536.1 hypothetical protein N7477_007106 [Penicillium maclennaniae]